MNLHVSNTAHDNESPKRAFPQSPFRLFEDFFNDWVVRSTRDRLSDGWRPVVDILERDGQLVIMAEVPGLSEKDIELKMDGNLLTISGTRKPEAETEGFTVHQMEGSYGSFSRSFTLPAAADTEKVNASYKNGILTVTIPSKPESQPKILKINS